jgi:hypothetical protein
MRPNTRHPCGNREDPHVLRAQEIGELVNEAEQHAAKFATL